MTHPVRATRFEPDPEFTSITMPVEVWVHPSTALLNDYLDRRGDVEFPHDGADDPSERSGVTAYDASEGSERPIVIHLIETMLHLSVVTHEAAHAALFMYQHEVLRGIPHATAARHIGNHDETIPYVVGNLTALVWFWLGSEGFVLDPED